MSRIKLLWMSDAPTLFTGFGTVTKEILQRLASRSTYEVACVGWGYDGWPYDRDEIPYAIYPSAPSRFGEDVLTRACEDFGPDIVVTLGDLWMTDWMRHWPDRGRVKFVTYFPMDGGPLPPSWGALLEQADLPIAYSQFGRRLVNEVMPHCDVEMIYHGVDTEAFRPLDKSALKKAIGLEGKYIVGCVARNQPRKNFPILLRAFAEFSRDKDDARLYLHTNPDDIGWDILELLKRYGVFDRTMITRTASVRQGLSKEQLNRTYNLFDVFALPTSGEGFGLPIVEAMAAGVPVIATACSACLELLEGRGEFISAKETITVGRYNIEHVLPDTDDLIRKLDLLYENATLRDQHSRNGLRFARTLDWANLITQWDTTLKKVYATSPTARPDPNR